MSPHHPHQFHTRTSTPPAGHRTSCQSWPAQFPVRTLACRWPCYRHTRQCSRSRKPGQSRYPLRSRWFSFPSQAAIQAWPCWTPVNVWWRVWWTRHESSIPPWCSMNTRITFLYDKWMDYFSAKRFIFWSRRFSFSLNHPQRSCRIDFACTLWAPRPLQCHRWAIRLRLRFQELVALRGHDWRIRLTIFWMNQDKILRVSSSHVVAKT